MDEKSDACFTCHTVHEDIVNRARVEGVKEGRAQVIEEISLLMDDDLHFTDYSGNTISLPVKKWERILETLRGSK